MTQLKNKTVFFEEDKRKILIYSLLLLGRHFAYG